MNLKVLSENKERILNASRDTLDQDAARHIRYEINWLLSKPDNNWDSLKDAFDERLSEKEYTVRTKEHKRYYFKFISEILYPGLMLFGRNNHVHEDPADALKDSEGYKHLNGMYQGILDGYVAIAKEAGKKYHTIITHCRLVSMFFRHLQNIGIASLPDATPDSVMEFFYKDSLYEKQLRSYSYKEKITVVLENCLTIDEYYTGCRHVLSLIPKFRYVRKNIQYLRESELRRIRDCLDSEAFSYRDRAVIMLLLYTGMRSCDIASLRKSDIDWENETISLVQQKTAEPITIPMLSPVGNALYDYLCSDRSSDGSDFFFPRMRDPLKCIPRNAVWIIADKAYRIAGIRQGNGERRGTHLFRHYVATKMLENGASRPVISRTLGHTNPDSLETYLHTDFEHLKVLALSIEKFPVPEEVWKI